MFVWARSSGSPVLNKQGFAVALNAAGQEGTASAFFLPLDRVCYSLELLRSGEAVPRGTCLAAFLFKPFDELIRVGLQKKHEQQVLEVFQDATGMLVVDSVLCEQQGLRVGDILLSVNDEICVGFVQLEAALDRCVGETVRMQICRAGEESEFVAPVQDLHALIPRSFVELGLDILHSLSYHAAKRVHIPLDSGVYLARAGYVFDSVGCGRAALVTSVAGKSTPNLDTFVKALAEVPDRQYFQMSWYELVDFRRDRTLKTGFAKMARAWSPLRVWRCARLENSAETWIPVDVPMPREVPRPAAPGPAVGFLGGDRLVRQLQGSLVTVRFRTDRRFNLGAAFAGSSEGVGLLVDAQLGLVLTDRHSAPQSLGDVEVTFGGTTTVDAEIALLHPLHNIVILRCDMTSITRDKLQVRAAKLATGLKATLRPGEGVVFVGFDGQHNAFSSKVTVAGAYLPSGRDEFPVWDVPRFRERNLEIVVLADTPEDVRGGVLCDPNGVVRAIFAAFDWQGSQGEETTESFGISVGVFAPYVEALRKQPKVAPVVASLDIEVSAVDVAILARGEGGRLPEEWWKAIGKRCAQQGQLARALRVSRVLPMGASAGMLLPGDILLSINGHTVTCGLDMEEALRLPNNVLKRPAAAKKAAAVEPKDIATPSRPGEAKVRFFREGKDFEVAMAPAMLGSDDDSQVMIWAGVVLRHTPRCILERCGESIAQRASGVFAQAVMGGSPADARDFMAHWFLVEVDGHPIQTLDDVLKALEPAAGAVERRWIRVRMLDLNGQEHVKALQCDPLYFPTLVLRRGEHGRWQCEQH